MVVIGKLQAARDSIRLLSLALGLSPKVGKSQRWWRAGYEFSANLYFQISRFTDVLYALSYSNRDFFKIASACLTCRSIFAPVPACKTASYTPSYPENSHMAREAMKPADIPKWAVRDNIDRASSPQCALPSHPIHA